LSSDSESEAGESEANGGVDDDAIFDLFLSDTEESDFSGFLPDKEHSSDSNEEN